MLDVVLRDQVEPPPDRADRGFREAVDVDGEVDVASRELAGDLVQRDDTRARGAAKVEVVAREERRQRDHVGAEVVDVRKRSRRAVRQTPVARPDVEDREVAPGDVELLVEEVELGDRVEQVAADAGAVDVVRLGAEEAVLVEPLEQPQLVVEAREVGGEAVAICIVAPLLPHVAAGAPELLHVDAAANVVGTPLRRGRGGMSAVTARVLGEQRMIRAQDLRGP